MRISRHVRKLLKDTWSPKSGTENATYVVYDNSTGGPEMLPLTGTGN
jgi:hypothetical protein